MSLEGGVGAVGDSTGVCTGVRSATLRYITLLHYTVLGWAVLHYITLLYYTLLHCNTRAQLHPGSLEYM
eukprot:4032277-Pyramimonas_sp.AAC.1